MPANAAAKRIPRMIKPFVVRSFGGGSGPYTTLFSLLNLDLLKLMFPILSVIFLYPKKMAIHCVFVRLG